VITQKDLVFSSTKDCNSNLERLDDLMKDSHGDDSTNIDERLLLSSMKDFFTSEGLDDLMKDERTPKNLERLHFSSTKDFFTSTKDSFLDI
jgi:hypothetical protein